MYSLKKKIRTRVTRFRIRVPELEVKPYRHFNSWEQKKNSTRALNQPNLLVNLNSKNKKNGFRVALEVGLKYQKLTRELDFRATRCSPETNSGILLELYWTVVSSVSGEQRVADFRVRQCCPAYPSFKIENSSSVPTTYENRYFFTNIKLV